MKRFLLVLLCLFPSLSFADSSPDAFTFTDYTNVHLSTVYTSGAITVAGIDEASAITIAGGTYSKNGGAYTADAGTVVVTDVVTVRGTSSASYNTAVNVVLTIGGVSDTFTVTTKVQPSAGRLSRTILPFTSKLPMNK